MKTVKVLLLICCAAFLLPQVAVANSVYPVYSSFFGDAVTGDNEFTADDGLHHWFINTGADSYANDFYERPVIQNFKNHTATGLIGNDSELVQSNTYYATDTSSPAYFGYLDIVQGRYGFDSPYMFFAIELYSEEKVGANGIATSDFGEGAFYNIRISPDENGAGGLMLQAEAAADFQTTEYQIFNPLKTFGYLDTDRDVGGTGGITAVNENSGGMTGFEDEEIADGKLSGTQNVVLEARMITDPVSGRPVVEFKFDYLGFNTAFTDYAITPDTLQYLEFTTVRGGPQDEQNYLWNDKYNIGEAGTPYFDGSPPQNLYELDTLRGTPAVVPVPGTILLLGSGIIGLLGVRKKLRS